MIGVDLSDTTRNLTYKDIVAFETIKEGVFEHETTTCETQPHIVSRCNEEDEENEDDNKDINGEKVTQYEYDKQPSKLQMELENTNEMVKE